MTTEIKFTVKGRPKPLKRHRHTGKITYDPIENKEAKQAIAWEAKAALAGRGPLHGPVSVAIIFMYEWPVSFSKSRREKPYGNMHCSRPDLDNLIKMVLDGINGIVFDDDCQVAQLTARKFYGSEDKTVVFVFEFWGGE